MDVDALNGWQTGRSLLDCQRYMLENHVACDVTFTFTTPEGSTVSLGAHSYMLRCRSAVFDAMFSGNFREKTEKVVVTDIEPDVFMEVLRYIYYDEAKLTCHNVLHMLFAAKKYWLELLVSRCQNFLMSEMSVENVCTILSHSLCYDEVQLIADCVEFAMLHANSVIKSDDFLEVSHDALLMLLSNDEFSLPDEMDLFRACMKWAEKQKGDGDERSALDKAFYQIRFLMLQPADVLCIKAEHPNVFTDKEAFWLLHKLMNQGNPKEINCDMSRYNFNERRLIKGTTIANRFKCTGVNAPMQAKLTRLWACQSNGPDRISFKCSEDVFFRGITIYGGYEVDDKHSVNMKLLSGGDTLSSTTLEIFSDGTDTPVEVPVNKPVLLEEGKLYTVEAEIDGPCTYYGQIGESEITCNDLTVTYVKYNGPNNGTCIEMGQIPQIVICRT